MNSKKIKVLIQDHKRNSNNNVDKFVNDPIRIEKKMKKVYSKKNKLRKVHPQSYFQSIRSQQSQQIKPNKPFITPMVEEITTPDWFKKTDPIQVSIIIPLFRSKECIQDQIRNWPLKSSLSTELIYVDDCCPEQTFSYIVNEWQKRSISGIGKILKHDINGGFGPTCNSGANFASGNFLIFLNADTIVTPNWVEPMYERLVSDAKIGIVGNLQLNGSRANVDSAGSEWSWKRQSFLHIGRNIYLEQELVEPIKYNKIPQDLLQAGPRDMVTGACFIIRKKLFNDIGQFDTNYRIGYWEDSDLCMKVKDAGFQIWYEPKSIIYHKVGLSKGGGHPYRNHNKEFFKSKWINNFKVDRFCRPRPGLMNVPMSIKDNIKDKVVDALLR
jgi:O-antigen biosynthesis protein